MTAALASIPTLPEGWRFEEPPASARKGREGRDFSPLIAAAGRWVLLEERGSSSSTAASAKKAAIKRHGGRWEHRTVRNKTLKDGKPTFRHYLRYVGREETA